MKTNTTKSKNPDLIFLLFCVCTSLGVSSLYAYFTNSTFLSLFSSFTTFAKVLLLCNLVALILYIQLRPIQVERGVLEKNELEDTKWLKVKDLKKFHEFSYFSTKNIQKESDGSVIYAKVRGKNAKVITTKALHTLIVGTTGSGKTTGFVDQNISLLSKTKTKPTLIISDPKRELFEKHSKSLRKQGYKIRILDLRDPYHSSRWNPLTVLQTRLYKMRELENNIQNKNGKYYSCGEEYLSYEDCKNRKVELEDEVKELARDFIDTLCPIKNRDQPTWEEGARNLILSMLLAFCEDVYEGKMEPQYLQLFNLYHNLTKYSTEDTGVLKQYLLSNRKEYSVVPSFAKSVLVTKDKTLTSYLSELHGYLQSFCDDGIFALTTESDFSLSTLDETPTALFLIIPDEKASRLGFASLFISQLYKELVSKASENERKRKTGEQTLLRPVYFILDEFGNLPKISGIEQMLTVSRSRNIRFQLVLQSFGQLKNKYNQEVASIVKSNCNVKIFIGSDDFETRKEFSELCGQKKTQTYSLSTSKGGENSSYSVKEHPLITPGNLERLNGNEKGRAIVSIRGYEPLDSFFTPSYKLPKLYFVEGKETRVKKSIGNLKKQDFTCDIVGKGSFGDIEAAQLKFEKEERERSQREGDELTQNINDLDKSYFKVTGEIEEAVNRLAESLGEEREVFENAKLENLPLILSSLYDQNESGEHRLQIKGCGDYIKRKLLELDSICEKSRLLLL